jgi:dihydroorotate dehydrogenase (fumarate)
MIDLKTEYLGLQLKNPLIVGSSRISGDLNTIKQCVDAGASAIVLKSLFEEQIVLEAESRLRKGINNEIYYWFPEANEKVFGLSKEEKLQQYLDYVSSVKKSIDVPVIASINCTSADGWPNFASKIEAAGADALELNIAIFPFNSHMSGQEIEEVYFKIAKDVKAKVNIPVSIKLGYNFTNIESVAFNLVKEGVDGLVLFNRYFRPNIDINTLKLVANENFSTPEEHVIPLRWIGLLNASKINCDLVASTGIHNYEAVIKQILAGAKAVQLTSTLYLNGIQVIEEILKDMEVWMLKKKFNTIEDFRSSSLEFQTTDSSFERIQYMKRDFIE